MEQKKKYIITAAIAVLHNNKRYEQGSTIELTDEEAENLAIYIKIDTSEQEKQKQEELEKQKQEELKEQEEQEKQKQDKKGKK